MLLYLVRHAHALNATEKPDRPLSPQGHSQILRLASFLRGNPAFQPSQLWHSPLLRASQTASLLAAGLPLDLIQVETPGLLPKDDPEPMAQRLKAHSSQINLALIGHEPHLSALASLLIRGKSCQNLFKLSKGAVIALETSGKAHKKNGLPRWQVRWHLDPALIPLL